MTGEFTEKQTISTIPDEHTGFNGEQRFAFQAMENLFMALIVDTTLL